MIVEKAFCNACGKHLYRAVDGLVFHYKDYLAYEDGGLLCTDCAQHKNNVELENSHAHNQASGLCRPTRQ